MANTELVSALRAEIERKYREAIQALETLSGYLAGSSFPTVGQRAMAAAKMTRPRRPAGKSRVDTVLDALSAAGSYKTVEQLHAELQLPEDAIRAVLYSKYVTPKIQSKKVGKKLAFRRRLPKAPNAKAGAGQTTSDLVRLSLSKHSEGQTPAQIADAISVELAAIGGTKNAVGAALYNMKKTGKVIHDESAGTYRLAN